MDRIWNGDPSAAKEFRAMYSKLRRAHLLPSLAEGDLDEAARKEKPTLHLEAVDRIGSLRVFGDAGKTDDAVLAHAFETFGSPEKANH